MWHSGLIIGLRDDKDNEDLDEDEPIGGPVRRRT